MTKQRIGDTDGPNKPAPKPRSVGASDDAAFVGYVNVNLTDKQKAEYVAWMETGGMWDALETAASTGVHLSVKREIKTGGYLASGTMRAVGHVNAGLVVTARGRDAATAFGRLLFTLWILGVDNHWEATKPATDPDRW